MRYFLTLIAALLLPTISVHSGIEDDPDHTILWNRFSDIVSVNQYIVGVAPEGLAVAQFDAASELFQVVNVLLLDVISVDMKRSTNQQLIVRTADDHLLFFDISTLPTLQFLGEVDPGVYYDDFVVVDSSLYLSRWFDGIWRYHLDDYSTVRFADSSMKGILVTQLDVDDNELYALDQYNGVLRYDLSAPGFGQFLDYLFVPRVTTSFSHYAGMFALTLGDDTLLLGEFGHIGSGIVDTVVGSITPQRSFLLDSVAILVSDRSAEVISLADHSDRTLVELTGQGFRGEIVTVGNREQLLLPDSIGGVTLFDIQEFDSGIQALRRSGPIEDLLLANDLLLTSGGANPIDVFAPESEGFPEPEYTMFGSMHGASALERNGDTLFAYYADLNRVVVVLKATNPDSFFLERSFSVDTSGVQRIQFVPRPLGTFWPFLIIGGFDINMYTIDDSSRIEHAATWNFVGRIETAIMHDSLLLVSTSKSQLFVMEVLSDFTTELRSAISLPGRAQAMIWANDRLMLFVHDELYVINLDNPSAPNIEVTQTLPIGVLDIDIDGNRMYTIGPDGAGIFSLDSAMPELLAWGGRPGHIIAANSRMLATSDGGSVHIYQFQTLQSSSSPQQLPTMFSLDQNYPNPFNASTVIHFTLYRSARVKISVVNALGQTVSVLVDRFLQPGDHQARWDGRNAAGIDVASGMYFYRLSAGDETAARKMMLIK